MGNTPTYHHIDKRAAEVAARPQGGERPDDLLTTTQLAQWTGLSVQFFEIGRHKGYGPVFVRISSRRVRYKRADVLAWLASRTHASTAEYR